MASWQDGAEYAPVERPDGFATPVVEPLPDADPFAAATPGPGAPPADFQRSESYSPPLEQVQTAPQVQRNPREPFATLSTLMTGDSAWGAAHRSDLMRTGQAFDPRQPITTSADALAPPTGDPLDFPPPTSDPVAIAPPGQPQPAPAPGVLPGQQPSGEWLAQNRPASTQPATPAQRQMTGIAILMLLIGVVFSPLGPASMLVAGGIALRLPSMKAPAYALLAVGTIFMLRLLFGDVGYDTLGSLYRLVCLIGLAWIAAVSNRASRR